MSDIKRKTIFLGKDLSESTALITIVLFLSHSFKLPTDFSYAGPLRSPVITLSPVSSTT